MQWSAIAHLLEQETKDYIKAWQYFPQCDSTNQQMLSLAKAKTETAESIAGTLIICDEQTRGRGRNNNTWHANKHQSLLFSLGMHLDDNALADERVEMLSLIVGMAICNGLQKLNDENLESIYPKLKWPNDIMLGAGKLAGILIESQYRRSKGMQLVIGVGVNVFASAQVGSRIDQKYASIYSDIDSSATSNSLVEAEHLLARAKALAAILDALVDSINHFQNMDIADFVDNWRVVDFYTVDDILKVSTQLINNTGDAQSSYEEMIYKGIDDKGKIQFIDSNGQWRVFNNTDIRIRKDW